MNLPSLHPNRGLGKCRFQGGIRVKVNRISDKENENVQASQGLVQVGQGHRMNMELEAIGPSLEMTNIVHKIHGREDLASQWVEGQESLSKRVRSQADLESAIKLTRRSGRSTVKPLWPVSSQADMGWEIKSQADKEVAKVKVSADGAVKGGDYKTSLDNGRQTQRTDLAYSRQTWVGRQTQRTGQSLEFGRQPLSGRLLQHHRARSLLAAHPRVPRQPPLPSHLHPPKRRDGAPRLCRAAQLLRRRARLSDLMRASMKSLRVDAVVASDGSGRYRSVSEAVNAAPSYSARRHVIYVKKGVYVENVEVKKKKRNIMMVGDGIGATVITGNRNFMQGWTTFRTATFAVSGPGFIARDITFRNTAGAENHQAVALRVDSDRSAFFRCSIEGHQDTLYAHSLRQFYRDCHIFGTIDFIFGNGLVVLQRCHIHTRRPLPDQKPTITAQGRKDPNQNTGFSLHGCFVHANYPTYLGRPWKAFSRTVIMQSYLGAQVQAGGWLEWAGDFGLSTLWYGEYGNYGPGARLSGRVGWPGYHVIRDAAVAGFFTVRRFIDGLTWLPRTGVEFTADLYK
ncbi:hypothetical protein ZIOFF_036738 [Zingiber officinale]|uniref:Pectinesterase n=1 Tax=Zingiber officinale TaxID=94328 RepID=A0A8J5GAG2_ZINOF|nr:hypothetical protein ZIOFF_036738 [Zingiber officinale]